MPQIKITSEEPKMLQNFTLLIYHIYLHFGHVSYLAKCNY